MDIKVDFRGDTIAALATPPGEGGIGIVRISGSEALDVLLQVFHRREGVQPDSLESHRMYHGFIKDLDGTLDECMVVLMRAPKSYTREDVAEIHCHGGRAVCTAVLQAVLRGGARLAEPGEFTKRAFLNGRVDLLQAEAVMDTIRARTEQSVRTAARVLAGHSSRAIFSLRDSLLGCLAHLEATLDYPDEDIDLLTEQDLKDDLSSILKQLRKLVSDSRKGRIYRDGIQIGIVGRPNVGKSSVFNTIVRENRAIVTDTPGTTRDVIEELVSIEGVPILLRDTAGIRQSGDRAEIEGVERAERVIAESDLILLVVDASVGVEEAEKAVFAMMEGRRFIVVANKADLGVVDGLLSDIYCGLKGIRENPKIVLTSVVDRTGFDELEESIAYETVGKGLSPDAVPLANLRHMEAASRALLYVEEALASLDSGVPMDLIAIDVRGANTALGEITGDTVDEEVIDRIFADFCIGK